MSISLQNVVGYVAVALFLLIGALAMPQSAAAAFGIPAGGVELEGFAWSAYAQGSNVAGVGWISMNCSNTDTCSTSNYGVTLQNSGNLTGYAWSSTVGWIKFDPAGPYPNGTGVLDDDAQVIGGSFAGNLNLGGWARVCAAAANPATCSGGTNANAGGWDGWIALAGIADDGTGYGITMTPTGAANGPTNFAWGGSVVTGWIDFSPNSPVGVTPVTFDVDPPIVTFDCSPNTSPIPDTDVTCNYTVDDPTSNCELRDGAGTLLEVPLPSNTSLTVSPSDDTLYTLTCTNASGPSAPEDELITVTPTPAPNPVIDINVPDIVRSGTSAEVEINVYSEGGSRCDLFGPGLTGIFFDVPVAGSYTNTFPTAGLSNKAAVAIVCSVANGSPFRQSESIEVVPAIQEL